MVEKEGIDEGEAMKAYRAVREESNQDPEVAERDEVSSALVDWVDAMLQNLEKEIDDVDAKIGAGIMMAKLTPEEMAAAAMYLKDTLGKDGVQELISNLSKDGDGKILVEDIVRLGSRAEEVVSAEAGERPQLYVHRYKRRASFPDAIRLSGPGYEPTSEMKGGRSFVSNSGIEGNATVNPSNGTLKFPSYK
ncbi:hypothetical protein RHGRI_025403 [Rhododendron griersonianum]|uniref:EF-hand domain-containing protein n=2 Tax=Rhododendron griersonianum TaxID=479676 RepID=A0AAV6IRD9_9ERIC|nr:hypothetical protein RHGRI_025403 [Rhododendron griersonianum]